jgi:hypothetical protein
VKVVQIASAGTERGVELFVLTADGTVLERNPDGTWDRITLPVVKTQEAQ